MINYYFLEYFRGLVGLTGKQLSEACGKTNPKYYSHSCREHTELPPECVTAIADALGIAPGWITQSPVLFSKQDLDDYITQHLADCDSPLVDKTDKPNQYLIVSQASAGYLMNFAEKKRELSRGLVGVGAGFGKGHALDELTELLKHSFLDDPDYVKMPLRPMLSYASSKYESIPAFARALASSCPDVISKSGTEAFIRKLVMAPSIPSTTVDYKVMDSFATFANITMDQAMCDFRISSHESVFNLFLAASIIISGWTISEDDKGVILTLTNPKYLPSAKAPETASAMPGFPAGFQL